jgi:hypothetical protein
VELRRAIHRRLGGAVLVAVLAGCVSLISADSSLALTNVGQAPGPASSPCSADTFLQTGVASGTSYTVQNAGVIVNWGFWTGSPVASDLKLKVGRPSGAGATIVGEDPATGATPNADNTFGARIPVQAGDDIGIYTSGTGPCSIPAGTSDTFAYVSGDLAPGSFSAFSSANSFKFPVDATVEPDADQDGFGDHTQDYCDTDPTTQGPCRPASVEFGSEVPGVSTPPQTITLSNTSPSLQLAIVTIATSGDFKVSSDGCSGHNLGQGASCQVGVLFDPTAAGIRTGTLSITDPAANGSPHTIALSGTGAFPGGTPTGATPTGATPTGGTATGERAAALNRCKKQARKHDWSHARLRKCKRKARLLPI